MRFIFQSFILEKQQKCTDIMHSKSTRGRKQQVQAWVQQTHKTTAAAMLNLLWKDEMDKQFQCFIWLQNTTRNETSQKERHLITSKASLLNGPFCEVQANMGSKLTLFILLMHAVGLTVKYSSVHVIPREMVCSEMKFP